MIKTAFQFVFGIGGIVQRAWIGIPSPVNISICLWFEICGGFNVRKRGTLWMQVALHAPIRSITAVRTRARPPPRRRITSITATKWITSASPCPIWPKLTEIYYYPSGKKSSSLQKHTSFYYSSVFVMGSSIFILLFIIPPAFRIYRSTPITQSTIHTPSLTSN